MGTYVIVRQGDGNTTLAHAAPGFQAKTERPGHKYILRIVNAIGTRYFYTKDQVQAYYNEQKKKIQDAAKPTLGLKEHQNVLKKGLNAITTQSQENTAKWKNDRKQTAESANNLERAKAKNNYAQREYYDAKKDYEKTPLGKVASKLGGKKTGENEKPDQNGRSRGQSNLYVKDEKGNTYRPGVISEKPRADDHTERLQGRKRNVTGTADPIQKGEATGLGPVGQNDKPIEKKTDAEPNRKKTDKDEMPTADPKHNYVQDRINNLNDQIVSYNEELDKLEAAGHGLADKETKDYLKQAVPKMVGDAAASYIVTSSERDQADQGMKESYESIQKDLQSIQNDPNASAQAKRYARKVEQDLQEYQEAVDTYNMLCDKNPGGMSKRVQQKMQAEIEKKQKALIKDGGYNGQDASWATDSIEASLDAYKKVSNSSMYTREEMMSYGGLIEGMLLTWQKAGLTQEDWNENFKLH